jgi:anti-anti-sigma factor
VEGQGPPLVVQVVSSDRATTVYVRGEIDIANVGRLLNVLTDEVEFATGAVYVDAHGVDFIGSVGLRTLALSRQFAQERGIDFALVNPSPAVTRVLAIIGDELLPRR